MAHLGNIGARSFKQRHHQLAPYVVVGKSMPSNRNDVILATPSNGRVQGIAKIGGVATGGIMVRIYVRETGGLIASMRSKADGTYVFKGLDPTNYGAYCVVFFDPQTGAPYNYTVARDHLTAG